ncbi:MAG: ribonuclease H-like YkuK family protein [Halanaerobiales bacterium]|nr:ribonuclease H-like YkuK family protein [Halanaerobiales bacterium]
MFFISPTRGKMNFDETYKDIAKFVNEAPDLEYQLIVGCDSQTREENVCFVTAVVIYRLGKGGRFYYLKEYEKINRSIRQRIFYETAKSLEVASEITRKLSEDDNCEWNLQIEIHLDVGQKGKTRELIKEVVGIVVGNGYDARIKPDSYCASKVADRYTK